MLLDFVKMHGTGNDFIILDQFSQDQVLDLEKEQIEALCDRRFGIGADGLIIIRKESGVNDFKMIYFNADGNPSSMCGNGGRCIVMYAYINRYIGLESTFIAVDGIHNAEVKNDKVILGMSDVTKHKSTDGAYELDTGSPHLVKFTSHVSELKVKDLGEELRYSPKYKEHGINVNFAELKDKNEIFMRTYERGVEDETYSCGTGVTACAIAAKLHTKSEVDHWYIKTPGGNLEVMYQEENGIFRNIRLVGPARIVYKGQVLI